LTPTSAGSILGAQLGGRKTRLGSTLEAEDGSRPVGAALAAWLHPGGSTVPDSKQGPRERLRALRDFVASDGWANEKVVHTIKIEVRRAGGVTNLYEADFLRHLDKLLPADRLTKVQRTRFEELMADHQAGGIHKEPTIADDAIVFLAGLVYQLAPAPKRDAG
jgi:hypothetical protein